MSMFQNNSPFGKSKPSTKTLTLLKLNIGGNLEKSLEKELQQREEKKNTAKGKINRWRERVAHIVHGKAMLVTIVFLCILDCVLVMGGLILELEVMQDMSKEIIRLNEEVKKHEQNVIDARSGQNDSTSTETTTVEQHGFQDSHSYQNKVAHGLHYASIAILAVLLLETLIKIVAFGRKFLRNKFEIFDAIIVTASFAVDLAFLKGTTTVDIVYNAQVLSFMLPWRVIRVVNSMIVSLMSHEHIKLLLMFKSKQYIQKQVTDLSEDLDTIRQQMAGIKTLAITEGIPDWKISKVIGDIFMKSKKQKTQALNTMVSMAMGNAVSQNRKLAVLPQVAEKDNNVISKTEQNGHVQHITNDNEKKKNPGKTRSVSLSEASPNKISQNRKRNFSTVIFGGVKARRDSVMDEAIDFKTESQLHKQENKPYQNGGPKHHTDKDTFVDSPYDETPNNGCINDGYNSDVDDTEKTEGVDAGVSSDTNPSDGNANLYMNEDNVNDTPESNDFANVLSNFCADSNLIDANVENENLDSHKQSHETLIPSRDTTEFVSWDTSEGSVDKNYGLPGDTKSDETSQDSVLPIAAKNINSDTSLQNQEKDNNIDSINNLQSPHGQILFVNGRAETNETNSDDVRKENEYFI